MGGRRSKQGSPLSRRLFVSFRTERGRTVERWDGGTPRRRRLRARRGFTLIELLVTIAIIATLAAIVAPSLFGNVGQARQNAVRSQIQILSLALDAYRVDSDAYPATDQG